MNGVRKFRSCRVTGNSDATRLGKGCGPYVQIRSEAWRNDSRSPAELLLGQFINGH
jgi:hypothetical protein